MSNGPLAEVVCRFLVQGETEPYAFVPGCEETLLTLFDEQSPTDPQAEVEGVLRIVTALHDELASPIASEVLLDVFRRCDVFRAFMRQRAQQSADQSTYSKLTGQVPTASAPRVDAEAPRGAFKAFQMIDAGDPRRSTHSPEPSELRIRATRRTVRRHFEMQ